MKHDVVIAGSATLEEHPNSVVCDLADSPPGPIALGLALLQKGLVDSVTLRPEKGRWVLRLSASGDPLDSRLSRYGGHRLELALSQNVLGHWLVFFLIYHRDGQAEVSHLDLETVWTTGAPCDFVLEVATFAPPLSLEDARRRGLFDD